MPFGIAAAPGTFQELMTKVLGTIKGTTVYLDDIFIYLENLDENYKNELFSKIQQAGLRVSPAKCQLLRKEKHFWDIL